MVTDDVSDSLAHGCLQLTVQLCSARTGGSSSKRSEAINGQNILALPQQHTSTGSGEDFCRFRFGVWRTWQCWQANSGSVNRLKAQNPLSAGQQDGSFTADCLPSCSASSADTVYASPASASACTRPITWDRGKHCCSCCARRLLCRKRYLPGMKHYKYPLRYAFGRHAGSLVILLYVSSGSGTTDLRFAPAIQVCLSACLH